MPFSAAVPGFHGINNALTIAQTGESQANRRAKNAQTADMLMTQKERNEAKRSVYGLQEQEAEMKKESNSEKRKQGLHVKEAVTKSKADIASNKTTEKKQEQYSKFYDLNKINDESDWNVARHLMIQDGYEKEEIDSRLGPEYDPDKLQALKIQAAQTPEHIQKMDEVDTKAITQLAVAEKQVQAALARAAITNRITAKDMFDMHKVTPAEVETWLPTKEGMMSGILQGEYFKGVLMGADETRISTLASEIVDEVKYMAGAAVADWNTRIARGELPNPNRHPSNRITEFARIAFNQRVQRRDRESEQSQRYYSDPQYQAEVQAEAMMVPGNAVYDQFMQMGNVPYDLFVRNYVVPLILEQQKRIEADKQ